MKLLLDTDIGSDIDDAVCLAYLLAQKQCELLGITTVTGQAVQRAKLASVLCRVAKKDIPIFPGLEKPLIVAARQLQAAQAVSLANWSHQTEFETGRAIDFLRKTIRAYPGEVTLLGIGPMTNIAALFIVDPEIPQLLKSLVLMAGNFTPVQFGDHPCEWNVLNDPHAAAVVYAAEVPTITSIGLDVTKLVTMKSDEVHRRFSHPLLEPVLDLSGAWFDHNPLMTFHDPLAAATLFAPSLCGLSPGNISIELTSRQLAGFTFFDRKVESPRHRVATSVDVDGFLQEYFSVFQ